MKITRYKTMFRALTLALFILLLQITPVFGADQEYDFDGSMGTGGFEIPEEIDDYETTVSEEITYSLFSADQDFLLDGKDSSLPAKFDPRESETYLTSIKNQGSSGSCWSFAAMASAEISMRKKSLEEDPDYSEMHHAYYFYNNEGIDDPLENTKYDYNKALNTSDYLNNGGNIALSAFSLSNWIGAADEEEYPFDDNGNLTTSFTDEACFESKAHLQNFYRLSFSYPENIKNSILEFGSVVIAFNSKSTYKASDGKSYYCPTSGVTSNHIVTCVGWDDDYSRTNFRTYPSSDGAWLIKNSWGNTVGDEGYFWISYEDTTLYNPLAFDYESSDNYDRQYFYDGSSSLRNISDPYKKGLFANVFTVKGDYEVLKAVSAAFSSTNVDYSAEIYKNPTDPSDPTSGEKMLSAPLTGTTGFSGYYTFPLPDPVYLEKGDVFAVVFEIGSKTIYTDSDSNYTWIACYNHQEAGESFYYDSSEECWKDAYYGLFEGTSPMTPRIRAFSDVISGPVISKVTSDEEVITLSNENENHIGEKDVFLKTCALNVEPYNATDGPLNLVPDRTDLLEFKGEVTSEVDKDAKLRTDSFTIQAKTDLSDEIASRRAGQTLIEVQAGSETMLTLTVNINGYDTVDKVYYKDGKVLKNDSGYVNNTAWYFDENGDRITTDKILTKDDNTRLLILNPGVLADKGKHVISEGENEYTIYTDEEGRILTGWLTADGNIANNAAAGVYYADPLTGSILKDTFVTLSGCLYYLDPDGIKLTGKTDAFKEITCASEGNNKGTYEYLLNEAGLIAKKTLVTLSEKNYLINNFGQKVTYSMTEKVGTPGIYTVGATTYIINKEDDTAKAVSFDETDRLSWNLFEGDKHDPIELSGILSDSDGTQVINNTTRIFATLENGVITFQDVSDRRQAVNSASSVLDFNIPSELLKANYDEETTGDQDGSFLLKYRLPVEYKKPTLKLERSTYTLYKSRLDEAEKNGETLTLTIPVLKKNEAGIFEILEELDEERDIVFAGRKGNVTISSVNKGQLTLTVKGADSGRLYIRLKDDDKGDWAENIVLSLNIKVVASDKLELSSKTVYLNTNIKDGSGNLMKCKIDASLNGGQIGEDEGFDIISRPKKEAQSGLSVTYDPKESSVYISAQEGMTPLKGTYSYTLGNGILKAVFKVTVTNDDISKAVKFRVSRKYDIVTLKPMIILPVLAKVSGTLTDVEVNDTESEFEAALVNGAIEINLKTGAAPKTSSDLKTSFDIPLKLTLTDSEENEYPLNLTLSRIKLQKTLPTLKAETVNLEASDEQAFVSTLSSYKTASGNIETIKPVYVETVSKKNCAAAWDEDDPCVINITDIEKNGNVKVNIYYVKTGEDADGNTEYDRTIKKTLTVTVKKSK